MEKTLNIAREYINMRYHLLPYIYQNVLAGNKLGCKFPFFLSKSV